MLTVANVARRLGVCNMTVYRLIFDGKLEASKVGKLWRIEDKHFDAYLKKARFRANSSGRAGRSKA